MQTPTGTDSTFIRFAEWVASAIGGAVFGFLGALVGFRTRLQRIEDALSAQKTAADLVAEEHAKEITQHRDGIAAEAMRTERAFRESLEAMRKESDTRHEDNRRELRMLRRQQFLMLKMIADIARHTGADKRFDDAIWSALADDADA
jgi:uncharacterized membrane protein YccC